MITFADVETKRDELLQITVSSTEYTLHDLKFLMLALYTYLPPMNQGVFIRTVFIGGETKSIDGYNYIHLETGEFTFGDKKIPLPEELIHHIRRIHDKSTSLWLLANVHDVSKPITNGHFTRIFNKLFGDKISTNYLKRLYHGTLPSGSETTVLSDEEGEESGCDSLHMGGSSSTLPTDLIYFEKVRISSQLLEGAKITIDNGMMVISTK